MSKMTDNLVYFIVGAALTLLAALIAFPALSSGLTVDNSVTNNNYPVTISEGTSSEELAAGLSMALAVGALQFDYSYKHIQWAAAMGAQLSDEKENAFAVGLANRFEWLDHALIHGAYSQSNGDHYLVLGITGRF